MPLLLATSPAAAADSLPALTDLPNLAAAPVVLLHEAGGTGGALELALRRRLPSLAAVDITSPRFGRLNYDALALLIVDLRPQTLDSHAGRRLADALRGLLRDGMALLFAGEAIGMTGSHMAPPPGAAADTPLRAGLGLLPGAVVAPSLPAIGDVRGLLARLSSTGTRLLAFDGSAALRCDLHEDAPRFHLAGEGSAILVAFAHTGGPTPTARLHPLANGQSAPWPA